MSDEMDIIATNYLDFPSEILKIELMCGTVVPLRAVSWSCLPFSSLIPFDVQYFLAYSTRVWTDQNERYELNPFVGANLTIIRILTRQLSPGDLKEKMSRFSQTCNYVPFMKSIQNISKTETVKTIVEDLQFREILLTYIKWTTILSAKVKLTYRTHNYASSSVIFSHQAITWNDFYFGIDAWARNQQ